MGRPRAFAPGASLPTVIDQFMTTAWTADHVAAIGRDPIPTAPVIDPAQVARVLPGHDLWDHWPVQEADGRTADLAGGHLHMLLSAPILPDPEARHALARIRLMHRTAQGWRDLGDLFPDGFSPGSREWSGSAIVSLGHDRLTVYFTAAGRRGEATLSFDQRLFETTADLRVSDGIPVLGEWCEPRESVVADGAIYARDMNGGGGIGTIKAFRDPAWFRDPADGAEYLVFAASLAGSASPWNGAVGLARRENAAWRLEAPLIGADRLNNELERPHLVHYNGLYYCFWSTQAKVFAEGGPAGPTGLYGMVATSLDGNWAPLNGTGLVFANPAEAPIQAYSWQVLHDLAVIGFVDRPGLAGEPLDAEQARRHFGGTPAPVLQLRLDGAKALLA